ncbi:hypothetical protein NC651_003563 [Populus alba x Populus x berolinensis]|nr:hypothetical protein NC651_003563 [Populus alba x Populus x berolinensis]
MSSYLLSIQLDLDDWTYLHSSDFLCALSQVSVWFDRGWLLSLDDCGQAVCKAFLLLSVQILREMIISRESVDFKVEHNHVCRCGSLDLEELRLSLGHLRKHTRLSANGKYRYVGLFCYFFLLLCRYGQHFATEWTVLTIHCPVNLLRNVKNGLSCVVLFSEMHIPNHFAYRLLNKTCIFLALVFPGEMEGCAATKSSMLVPKWLH